MGVYVVTGGSGGIGGKTVEILRSQGHEVVNVDLKDSDICANLATKEGRDEVIHTIHAQYPDGIDGLCCNAGVSGACGNLKLMISLNYFGATNLAHGLFDLLKKKGGSCVVTSSNTISQGAARMDLVDMLNYSQTKPVNEERILNIIEKFDESSLAVGNSIYVTTKYALARWARRVSASWAANGVRINTVAPGNAQLFAKAMKFVGPIRKALQFPTVFNLLGPLVNPSQPKCQLLGVANLDQMRLYNQVYQKLGIDFGIVNSIDGYDEISLTSDFKVTTNNYEKIFKPQDLGFEIAKPEEVRGGATEEEAKDIFDAVLENRALPAQKNIVLANAAFGIQVMEKGQKSIEECVEIARESIDSGKALATFKKFVEINS